MAQKYDIIFNFASKKAISTIRNVHVINRVRAMNFGLFIAKF